MESVGREGGRERRERGRGREMGRRRMGEGWRGGGWENECVGSRVWKGEGEEEDGRGRERRGKV